MQRTFYICTILALICISAIAWMVAQPQSAAAMSSAQESGTATIQGTLLKPDGSPAIGAEITVVLMDDESPINPPTSPQNVTVDPETATFEISVAPGTWRLSYFLPLDETNDEYDGFRRESNSRTLVSVADNQTVSQDLTLIELNATVRGSVLAPDGTVINAGHVIVTEGIAELPKSVAIVDGLFETKIMADIEHTIEIEDESGYFVMSETDQPDPYIITADAGSLNQIELQTRAIDASIIGTVYGVFRSDGQRVFGRVSEPNLSEYELVPLPNATVTARPLNVRNSIDESGYTFMGRPSMTVQADENGAFTINVPSGITWILDGGGFDQPTTVVISEPQAYEVDLLNLALPIAEFGIGETPITVDPEQLDKSLFLPVLVAQY